MNIVINEELNNLEYWLSIIDTNCKKETICLEFDQNHSSSHLNLDLLKKYIEIIKKERPKTIFKFKVLYIMDKQYLLDLDTIQIKELKRIDTYLHHNFKTQLFINSKYEYNFDKYPFNKTVTSSIKLEEIANKIKNTKTYINGNEEELSNYEKLMLIYEYVSNYVYNEGGDTKHLTTSHWIPVIDGDKIVCGGYSSLFKALSDRVFNGDEVKVLTQSVTILDKKDNNHSGHSNNLVFLKDDKYNFNGILYMDACWDSINQDNPNKFQAYLGLPLCDLVYLKYCDIQFEGILDIYLRQIPEYKYPKGFSQLEALDQFLSLNFDENSQYYMKKFNNHVVYKRYNETKFYTFKYYYIQCERDNIYNSITSLTNNQELFIEDLNNPIVNDYILKIREKTILNLSIDEDVKGLFDYINKNNLNKTETISINKLITDEIININWLKMKNEYKKEKNRIRRKNLFTFQKNINHLANQTLPIEAIFNSYKIIGESKGYDNKKILEFATKQTNNAIIRFRNAFDYKNCVSVLANINNIKTNDFSR